jgi:hypothetical protein
MDRGARRRGSREGRRIVGTAFYCVADQRYFLGAVGLVNSLRLIGHDEPVYVLDCGLSDEQRELLGGEAELVPGPRDAPAHVLKAIAPLAHPADVMVLIDTDMIVTRSLAPLIRRAAEGKVVAFRDRQQRFVPEWGELLGLGDARAGPYVSSGLVICERALGKPVLELLDGLQSKVDFELTFWRRRVRDYPFLYADQDLLNAILRTRVEADRLVPLEHRLAPTPPFEGLSLVDREGIRCAYRDGTEAYLLHHYARKPWLVRTRSNVYSRLLTRMLLAPDVVMRLEPDQLPPRLRTGFAGRAARLGVDILLVPAGIARRLRERRSAVATECGSIST